MIKTYYNQLAPFYRYLFPDWEKSVFWHAQVIDDLMNVTTLDPGILPLEIPIKLSFVGLDKTKSRIKKFQMIPIMTNGRDFRCKP